MGPWQKWIFGTAPPPEAAFGSKMTMMGIPAVLPLLAPHEIETRAGTCGTLAAVSNTLPCRD